MFLFNQRYSGEKSKKINILNTFVLCYYMSKKKKEIKEENIELKKKVKAVLERERVIANISDEANVLYDKGRFGERVGEKFQYSFVEGLFLLETKRMDVKDIKGKNGHGCA